MHRLRVRRRKIQLGVPGRELGRGSDRRGTDARHGRRRVRRGDCGVGAARLVPRGQRRDRPDADRGRSGVLAEVGGALAVLLPGRDRGPAHARSRAYRGADRVGGGLYSPSRSPCSAWCHACYVPRSATSTAIRHPSCRTCGASRSRWTGSSPPGRRRPGRPVSGCCWFGSVGSAMLRTPLAGWSQTIWLIESGSFSRPTRRATRSSAGSRRPTSWCCYPKADIGRVERSRRQDRP